MYLSKAYQFSDSDATSTVKTDNLIIAQEIALSLGSRLLDFFPFTFLYLLIERTSFKSLHTSFPNEKIVHFFNKGKRNVSIFYCLFLKYYIY